MDTIEKFKTVIHHHENVFKSTQHQRLARGVLPHDIFNEIIYHILGEEEQRNLLSFINPL
jgi:hypothetical protein